MRDSLLHHLRVSRQKKIQCLSNNFSAMSLREELAAPERLGDTKWLLGKFEAVKYAYVEFLDRTEAAETLNLWSQRLSRSLMSCRAGFDEIFLMTELKGFISSFDELLYLMIDRWSSGDPSYLLACRKSMQHMLKIRDHISAQSDIETIVPLLTRHAADYARDDARIAFGSLEAISRSSEDNCAKVKGSLPVGFIEDSIKNLVNESGRSGMIGRCLVLILGTHSEPIDWFDLTLPYIGDLTSYQALMTYFVEPMLKNNSNAEKTFYQFYELCSSLSSPSVEIGALKAAKNAKLDVSGHILSSKAIQSSLSCSSRNLRFDALSLLCCATRKLTAPLPHTIFDSIIENMHCLFAEGEPRARAEVLGSLQNLLDRTRISKSESKAQKLIEHIAHWCGQSLTPGMPYRCLSMATNLLNLLMINGYQKKVLSSDILRGLINCILSDFPDIRENCVLLLENVKHLPQVETQFENLTQHAFDIISGGRTGDSGARLLEFLNSRRPEANLGDKLADNLETMVKDAKADIDKASRSHRIYGYLIALKQVPPRNRHLMPIIMDIWDLCMAPLMTTAPEGCSDNLSNYCWKAVKESSLLVEALTKSISPSSTGDFDAVPLQLILDKLAYMLTSITHWGAFSAIPPAYIAIAQLDRQRALIIVWGQIEELRLRKKLRSVTRRSAGLPLLVTSTLTVKFDFEIVNALFQLANLPFADGELDELEMPQVHGMNCIRAVLTDASLSKESNAFIEQALELCFSRFRSTVWSLRNCAAMLFTSLHKRLFGVRGLPLPSSVFFQKYKKLQPLISNQLFDSSKSSELQEIYPALAILSKLQTVSRSDQTLAIYWEPVIELLGSPNWKVREIAAKVVGSMTHVESVSNVIHELISTMSLSNQNTVHGFALAINSLLDTVVLGRPTDQSLSVVSERIQCSQKILERLITNNSCLETSVELFRVWRKLGGNGRLIKFEDLPKPHFLNPSIATFEALQVLDSPEEVDRYAFGWSEVLRALPPDSWTPGLALKVLRNPTELPDLRSEYIRTLSKSVKALDFTAIAESLLDSELPVCIQQEALVLAAKSPDLDLREEAYSKWQTILLKFSEDKAPVESRRSSVSALGQFLQVRTGKRKPNNELLLALFKLLSDEEEDIRAKAAEASSRYFGRSITQASPECEKDLLGLISPEFITAKLSATLIEDCQNARWRFEQPQSDIFVVEKESLYRDKLRNIQIQGQFCKATPESADLANEARCILSGLDFEAPLQASSSCDLLEVRARIAAISA